MGVPSYNTEQELIQLESIGLSLQPDLAILLFSENDIEKKKWIFEKRSSWYADLAQRSYGVSLLFVALRQLRAAAGQPEQLISGGDYHRDSPRWQAIDRSLTAIQRHCEASSIDFVVFTRFGEAREAFDLVEGVGKREGFAVVNVSPWSDPRWAGRDPLELANSVVDNHPNPAGSRAFASLYAEYLERTTLRTTGSSTPSEALPPNVPRRASGRDAE